MNLNELHFPLEANVQNLAHFIDTKGTYAFTFGSPFCYNTPADLKEKQAFLLAAFNQQKKKNPNAEEIYTYYINDKEKKPHPDKKLKAAVQEAKIYRSDSRLLGSIQILLQRGMFRSYTGMNANPVFDAEGSLVGFGHYNEKNKCKDIYTCDSDFQIPSTALTAENISDLEASGRIHRVFSYDIVESEEADNRDRFLAIFSPSKKSELTNNRIRYYGCEDDPALQELLLTALFAFFWNTFIDIPLN